MCARHGLSLQESIRLLPLIERALTAPQNVRDRILALVEHNLTRKSQSRPTAEEAAEMLREAIQEDPIGAEAAQQPASPRDPVQKDLDEEILLSVARVLHAWAPSTRLLELGKILPDLFPPGFSFDDLAGDDPEPL